MVNLFWQFVLMIIVIVVVSILTAALDMAFQGNVTMIIFAGVFWMFIVGTALFIDRRG